MTEATTKKTKKPTAKKASQDASKKAASKPVAKKKAAPKKTTPKKSPAKKTAPKVDTQQGDLLDALDIGRRLEHARKSQNMTLQEAAEKTQIRAETLKALEENRYEELPEIVYVRGFIRIYAQVLGLDAQELLSDLGRYLKVEEKTTLTLPSPVEEGTLPKGKTVLASLLVVLLMGAIWTIVDRPTHDVLSPEASVPDTSGYAAMPDEVKAGIMDDTAAPAFERPVNLEEQAQAVVIPTVDAAPVAIEATSPVYLKALDEVWISVYQNGDELPVVSKVLQAGEGYAVPDNTRLMLDVGLPPALVIYVHGQRMGVSGIIDRRVRGLSLDPEYLKNTYYAEGIYQQVNITLPGDRKTEGVEEVTESENTQAPQEPEPQEVQKAIVEVPPVVIKEESAPFSY